MSIFFLILLLLSCITHCLSCTALFCHHHHHRRVLHQPFFPVDSSSPTPSPSSSPQPQQQPKFPFSSSTNTPPFFPSYHSPPPPFLSSLPTFPANISSLILHQTPHSKPLSRRLITVSVSVVLALACIVLIAGFSFLFYRQRHCSFANTKTPTSDSLRLVPPNTAPSDGHHKVCNVSSSSSEFLYLGTVISSRGVEGTSNSGNVGGGDGNGDVNAAAAASPYQRLGSPELHPLPPLSRQNFSHNHKNAEEGSSGEEGEEDFYSPRGSPGGKESPAATGSSSRRMFQHFVAENIGGSISNSSSPSYPSGRKESSASFGLSSRREFPAEAERHLESRISHSSSQSFPSSNSASPASLNPKSPDFVVHIGPIVQPPAPPERKPPSPSSPPDRDLEENTHSSSRLSNVSDEHGRSPEITNSVSREPDSVPLPPPPPPPPPRIWETVIPPLHGPIFTPPVLVTPSKPVLFQGPTVVSPVGLPQNTESAERNHETPKPKLKPLHWDKVRASSDRAMVWDQLKSSSFQLNEEMIETLFMVNDLNFNGKDVKEMAFSNQENRVLNPKKCQNIAILLRALNITAEEVCEALSEGNTDMLGNELLECLLKMAPTKEEEYKLKEYKDDLPFKLDPAERFLKAVLDIPFAFKRVEAMIYIANFDSEVEHLKRSFETLEAACEELRNSRMFLKLLEAVLKTGNRMNVGTNRGDAQAFKLDTLLKLVDVKGTDGKTTLLHFVVQEIIRIEGSRLSVADQSATMGKPLESTLQDDVERRKIGLQVVASLGGELTNVKKAATLDFDLLSSDVAKLAGEIEKIREVVKLNEAMGLKDRCEKFSESMNGFLKKAGEVITRTQAQESFALSLVKEITEYFHGNSAKEEAHPFRIFMVVRGFLTILDQVCKEVGKINERVTCQFPVSANPKLPPVFPKFHVCQNYSSSGEESS